jgi:hypothetical protein
MPQLFKDFHDHPDSVGETYVQHWRSAMGFALALSLSALACSVHAFVPGLCKSSASRTVSDLHQRMVTHRHRQAGTANQETCDAPDISPSEA